MKNSMLGPQEIDFLLTQALKVKFSELPILSRIKIALIESAALGRTLSDETLDLDRLVEVADAVAEAQRKIEEAFDDLDDEEFLKRLDRTNEDNLLGLNADPNADNT